MLPPTKRTRMSSVMAGTQSIYLIAVALGVVVAALDHTLSRRRLRLMGIPVLGVLGGLAVMVAFLLQFGSSGPVVWSSVGVFALEGYATYFILRLLVRVLARRENVSQP